jgi:hypothetical protein
MVIHSPIFIPPWANFRLPDYCFLWSEAGNRARYRDKKVLGTGVINCRLVAVTGRKTFSFLYTAVRRAGLLYYSSRLAASRRKRSADIATGDRDVPLPQRRPCTVYYRTMWSIAVHAPEGVVSTTSYTPAGTAPSGIVIT